MEIEKKRETVWKLKQKEKQKYIELISVEESGEVNQIKLSLKKMEDAITIEMNKSEFNNFLSILLAFKDVVIGSEMSTLTPDFKDFDAIKSQEKEESVSISEKNEVIEKFTVPELTDVQKSVQNEKQYEEELNPKEWDPW
ncbi:MAG: hypothetical protein KAX10_05810 [Candidatus Lokiarchaeota archaeon]|nr:hypothetical protein [Candidatus Lokiarchaeota archaeon]